MYEEKRLSFWFGFHYDQFDLSDTPLLMNYRNYFSQKVFFDETCQLKIMRLTIQAHFKIRPTDLNWPPFLVFIDSVSILI